MYTPTVQVMALPVTASHQKPTPIILAHRLVIDYIPPWVSKKPKILHEAPEPLLSLNTIANSEPQSPRLNEPALLPLFTKTHAPRIHKPAMGKDKGHNEHDNRT